MDETPDAIPAAPTQPTTPSPDGASPPSGDRLRTLKVRALLDLADELRRQADAGIKSEINTTLADHLMRRIARIEAGEEDRTGVSFAAHPGAYR